MFIRGLGIPISRSYSGFYFSLDFKKFLLHLKYRALLNVLDGDLALAIDKSIFWKFSKLADSLDFQSLHKLCHK